MNMREAKTVYAQWRRAKAKAERYEHRLKEMFAQWRAEQRLYGCRFEAFLRELRQKPTRRLP